MNTLLYTVYFIYFFCGMTQCFEGVFLPEFREYFHLGYEQQMYTMFAKNVPFLTAILIGVYVRRIGYRNCLAVAMALYAAGTLLLVPGLQIRDYGLILLGFFLIGLGFNFQLVAGNPLLVALGPARASSSRLNLGNALGAVAQIIAPATLTLIIPAAAVAVDAKLPYMTGLFAVLGGTLVVVTIWTALQRSPDVAAAFESHGPGSVVWRDTRLLFAFATIFVVLGVEAGMFGFYRNYLEDPQLAGLSAHQSQRLFTLYFALFAAGRLAASWVQKHIRPATHLLIHVAAAAVCLAAIVLGRGTVAIAALTAIGFFVSIFFPTLYGLAIRGLGDRTGPASGLLTMGFVGCAVIPVVQGRLADRYGLQSSYAIGAIAYVLIAAFAMWNRQERPAERAAAA